MIVKGCATHGNKAGIRSFVAFHRHMFDVIDGDELPPAGLLDGETLKSLNEDWKEAEDE